MLITRLIIDMNVNKISVRLTSMSLPSGNAFKLSNISLTRSFSVESVSVLTSISTDDMWKLKLIKPKTFFLWIKQRWCNILFYFNEIVCAFHTFVEQNFSKQWMSSRCFTTRMQTKTLSCANVNKPIDKQTTTVTTRLKFPRIVLPLCTTMLE